MTEMQFHLRASTAQGADAAIVAICRNAGIDHVAHQTTAIA
jgi:hypothetical protein